MRKQCTGDPVTTVNKVRPTFTTIDTQVVHSVAQDQAQTDDEYLTSLVPMTLTFEDKALSINAAGVGYDGNVSPIGAIGLPMETCTLDALKAPQQVREHIGHTRALDGSQTDAWGSYQARWTFHPDDGLNLTIWNGRG